MPQVPVTSTARASFISNGLSSSMVRDVLGSSAVTSTSTVETVLRELGLLLEDEGLLSYADETAWTLGGAEAYIATAAIGGSRDGKVFSRLFLAKAAVTFPTRPEDAVELWSQRLRLLQRFGVPTPHVYSTWKAVIYLDFVPETLQQRWTSGNQLQRCSLSERLVRIAAVIDACGFRPVGYLHDLRVLDSDVFVVDVGEDLSHWNFSVPGSMAFQQWHESQFMIPDRLNESLSDYSNRFTETRQKIAETNSR